MPSQKLQLGVEMMSCCVLLRAAATAAAQKLICNSNSNIQQITEQPLVLDWLDAATVCCWP
jgi:hypothetical protein